MENRHVAAMLDEIADLLELNQENAFRIRSYRNAARTVRDASPRLEDLVGEGKDLSEWPNIGAGMAEKIRAILRTGTCPRLEELRGKVPAELRQLTRIPGLGPRKAMQLYNELGVRKLDDLRAVCEAHHVAGLKGMGPRTEQKILDGLKVVQARPDRTLLKEAADYVQSLGKFLDGLAAVKQWEAAGSYRRRSETVGDLDFLVQADDREQAAEQILACPAIREVASRGQERITAVLESGLQVDFRFFNPDNFGAALMYFTGSKAHNIALRKRAVQRGWKLNEYGLFEGERQLAGATEESIYRRLKLPWIPPELREDHGELDAAERGELPELIEPGDVHGDLQSHTTASDGTASIVEMAAAARDRGYQFFAITDHSKRVTMAHGLDEDRLRRHAEAIRRAAGEFDESKFWLMAGVEVDILKTGKLDLDENVLAELDWVVAAVHYDREMDEGKMTDRLLAAIGSGVVNCLAHPLGRIIGRREPLRFDVGRVFDACREHGVRLEINAQPDRLDLPDAYCKRALEAGVGFTLGTDAHKPSDLDLMPLAVNVARRGWLRKADVLNTLTLRQLRTKLGRRMTAAAHG